MTVGGDNFPPMDDMPVDTPKHSKPIHWLMNIELKVPVQIQTKNIKVVVLSTVRRH